MESTGEEYVVGEDSGASFYTRYPNGIGTSTEAQDLHCPKCGDEHIKIIGGWCPPRTMMMGDKARCVTCLYEFHITENCWKWRTITKKTNP